MKAIIVDDEELAIEALKAMIDRVGGVDIKGMYTNPEEALLAIQEIDINVIFLDIEMGASHGMKIAKKLREKHEDTKIVFVTAHAEFAVDAFKVRADDYLLKPVLEERLADTVNRIRKELGKTESFAVEASKLTVNAMGNFQLYKNNEEVKWRTKKVKELFAYIWHHYPNPIPRSRIMEDIWGEKHGDSAVQIMHTSFYHLRKTIRDLGFDNPVQFVNEQYVLAFEVMSDIQELEQLLVIKKLNDDEIERVLELYSGAYFEEENYQWILPKQQYVKTQLLTSLERYVAWKIEADDPSLIVGTCLEKMLSIDPYSERFVYLAIDYYGKTKNIPKIIKIAGKFEELWKRELGISIPEEISSLYYKYITG